MRLLPSCFLCHLCILQVPGWVGIAWQEVLICFNELWSQVDGRHLLSFSSHVVTSLALMIRDYIFSLYGPKMTQTLICFNEVCRHVDVRRVGESLMSHSWAQNRLFSVVTNMFCLNKYTAILTLNLGYVFMISFLQCYHHRWLCYASFFGWTGNVPRIITNSKHIRENKLGFF